MKEKPKRRTFKAEYKQSIVQEAAACQGSGEIGALLRREGLYSSHLADWRKLAARGELSALKAKRRGPTPKENTTADKEVREMRREIARLRKRAERAEALVEVQKKVSQLLGIALQTDEDSSS